MPREQTMERRASSPADATLPAASQGSCMPSQAKTCVSPQAMESPFVLAAGPLLATLFLQGEDFLGENFGERLLSSLQS